MNATIQEIAGTDNLVGLEYLFIEVNRFAASEIHDIINYINWRKHNSKYPISIEEKQIAKIENEKIEKLLRAFVARKKLGTPTDIKKMRKEFDLPD